MNRILINKNQIICLSISVFSIFIYYIMLIGINNMYVFGYNWIYLSSVIGVISYIYILISWRYITGNLISLYSLFITFFYLFNFGQCILWAFNIHLQGEIGSRGLYYTNKIPSNEDILLTQCIVIISSIMIHLGSFLQFSYNNNKDRVKKKSINSFRLNKSIFKFCLFISPIVLISVGITQFNNYQNAQAFGYTALYYGEGLSESGTIFKILSRLFFPVLVGLLVGSNYNKNVVRIVYILFALNALISILIGDRGSWIYSLLILIIAHHYFYKKIKLKNSIVFITLAVFLSYISVAIVKVRNEGVSLGKIIQVLSDIEINPIISSVFTMGNTMGITTVLVKDGWDIFPYGNTFFYGILTAPSSRMIDILNLDYKPLGGWFSQTYLGISNGAGFSIVAEILLNFGPILLPIFMIIFGIVIGYITNFTNLSTNDDTIKLIFCLITTSVVINISRNVFSYNLGEVLFTTLQFFVYFYIFKLLFVRRGTIN